MHMLIALQEHDASVISEDKRPHCASNKAAAAEGRTMKINPSRSALIQRLHTTTKIDLRRGAPDADDDDIDEASRSPSLKFGSKAFNSWRKSRRHGEALDAIHEVNDPSPQSQQELVKIFFFGRSWTNDTINAKILNEWLENSGGVMPFQDAKMVADQVGEPPANVMQYACPWKLPADTNYGHVENHVPDHFRGYDQIILSAGWLCRKSNSLKITFDPPTQGCRLEYG
jgi:hypothetical protein